MFRFASMVCVVAVWGCSGSSANAPQNGEPPCLKIRSVRAASEGADGGGSCPKVDSEPAQAADAGAPDEEPESAPAASPE